MDYLQCFCEKAGVEFIPARLLLMRGTDMRKSILFPAHGIGGRHLHLWLREHGCNKIALGHPHGRHSGNSADEHGFQRELSVPCHQNGDEKIPHDHHPPFVSRVLKVILKKWAWTRNYQKQIKNCPTKGFTPVRTWKHSGNRLMPWVRRRAIIHGVAWAIYKKIFCPNCRQKNSFYLWTRPGSISVHQESTSSSDTRLKSPVHGILQCGSSQTKTPQPKRKSPG